MVELFLFHHSNISSKGKNCYPSKRAFLNMSARVTTSIRSRKTGVEICLDQSDTQSQKKDGEQVRGSGIEKATPSIVMSKVATRKI